MRENLQEKKMEQNNNNGGVCRYSYDRSEIDDEGYFPPGYRFDPSDQVLVVRYLKKKIMNQQLPFNEIMQSKFFEIDIYHNLENPEILAVSEQYKLPDGVSEWFIFTPRVRKDPNGSRPNRTAGNGYWKASGGDKEVVMIDDKLKGFKKSLVFCKKGKTPTSKGQKTNWLMNEYTIPGLVPKKRKKMGSADDNMILDEWVLCKVYKKKMAITEDNEEPATDSVSSVPEDVVSSVREVAQDGEQLFEFNAYKKQCTEQHNRGMVFADQNPTIEQQQLHINGTCIEQQPQPLFNAYKKQCRKQHNRALGFADQNPTIKQQQSYSNAICIEQQPQPLSNAYEKQCRNQHNRALGFADQNPTIEQQQLDINTTCIKQQLQPVFDAYKKQCTEPHKALLAFAENPTIEQHNRALLAFSEEPETDSVSSSVPVFDAYKKQCTEPHKALLAFAENPTIEQHNRALLAFSEEQRQIREVAQDVVSSVQEVAQDWEQLFDFNAYKKQRTGQHNSAVAFADQNPTIEQQQLHINTTCVERQTQPLFNAYKKQCTEQHNSALLAFAENSTIEQHNRALLAFPENPTIEQKQVLVNTTENYTTIEQQPQDKHYSEQQRQEIFAQLYIGFEACLNQSLEEQQQPGGGIPYQSAVVVADNEVYIDIDCLTFDQAIEQQQPPLINNTVSHNTDDQYNDDINQALRFYEL